MYIVSIDSLKSGERNGGGRAYLARLVVNRSGNIDRQFIKADSRNGRKSFSSNAHPGDVFEARRWLWDGNRQQYYGGTVWFGVQEAGTLCLLTREEALNSVGASAITSSRPSVPDHSWAERMVPDDLRIGKISDQFIPAIRSITHDAQPS